MARTRKSWRFRLDDTTTLEASAPADATRTQIRRRGRWGLAALLAVGAMIVAAVAFGGVSTDAYYYNAGDTVRISGDNMNANENVKVDVAYPDASLAQEHVVQADANGKFADSYTIKDSDPAGVYTVTATGESSGNVYTTTFDPPAHVYFATSGLNVSINVSYSGLNNGGNPISGSLSVPSSGTSTSVDTKPGSSLTFGFPSSVSDTGKICSLQSTSKNSPYTTGSDGTSVTITGTYTCVDTTPPDTTAPTLNLPSNITTEASSASGAVVTYTATANDNVDGPITPTCSPVSGSTFALGTTTVTCSATDTHNNTGSGSFTVTVVDTTAQGGDGADRRFCDVDGLGDGSGGRVGRGDLRRKQRRHVPAGYDDGSLLRDGRRW